MAHSVSKNRTQAGRQGAQRNITGHEQLCKRTLGLRNVWMSQDQILSASKSVTHMTNILHIQDAPEASKRFPVEKEQSNF
eukprot:scaffold241240_cov20-Tisochrysis_lutea.AAC.1